jgi:hypothetical protein
MAMTTVRGRYGTWESVAGESQPQFRPYVGLEVRFAPAYPFVTNTTATPSPIVVATAPRIFRTDASGYLSDPQAGFDSSGNGVNRNCVIVSSDDPDIWPHDWKYLVTFAGQGATNFRAFRTPAMSNATVDIAVLTPQRVPQGSTPTTAEIAAADAAASAAAAQEAAANIRRGQAGGVAALDADGDVNDADGNKILGGGGSSTPALADITGMSTLGKNLVATLISGAPATQLSMRGVIGAGTGNSNLVIGTTTGTAADAALTNTALGNRALDANTVHQSGDEIIDGVKQFLDPMKIVDGTAADNPVTKAQLDAVSASAGGTVTAATIGLGNVNNTSDAAKPVSTAQATALALKADKATPVFTGAITTDANAIGMASVSGLTTAISALGNTVTLVGNIARNHPITAAVLPAPPTVCVIWVTYGALTRPTAFNAAGDIWFNEEVS